MNRQMQKVIKNLGRNLDNMNVYSLFILSMVMQRVYKPATKVMLF